MFEVIKQIPSFLIDIMKMGFYPLPFIFTIFIIDQIKIFYNILWINDIIKKLIVIISSLILNIIIVLVNMMIIVSIFKIKFNGWIYLLNIIGNFALSCGTVDLVDVFQKFIQDKITKKT